MRTTLKISREEERMRDAMRQYQAPDMTALQEQKLKILLEEELGKKRLAPEAAMAGQIWRLARFISPWVWILQAVFLVFALLISSMQTEEWYLWNLSVMIPFLGVICVPELSKSFSREMWELEQSCYYSLRRLMAAKMAAMGIADGVLLIFLMAAVGSRGSGFSGAILAVLVPFQLSNAVYLSLFQFLKRRCSGYILTAAGFLMAGGMLVMRYYLPELPTELSAAAAAAIGTAGFIILLASGYEALKKMDGEENVKWNFGQTG